VQGSLILKIVLASSEALGDPKLPGAVAELADFYT